LFGWRTAKIVVETLPTTATVECLEVTQLGRKGNSTNQIADMLIGNYLYSFRRTSIASIYHLYYRFLQDGAFDDLKRLAEGVDTIQGFAEFLGISQQTFHYRASQTFARQLDFTIADVQSRTDQANG
jgi:DNA-binding CsgD family transcriptional regulator